MSSVTPMPSTLGGLKSFAKNLRRKLPSLTHGQALDQAALAMGLNNYRHAHDVLSRGPLLRAPLHDVYLTAYWFGRHPDTGWQSGRETLHLQLAKPLQELLKRHQVEAARNLVRFRMEFEDHLELASDQRTQEEARERLMRAGQTLRFIASTGLVPATTRSMRRALDIDAMPGRDHVSRWVDPVTGEPVCLDEPYERSVASRYQERDSWLVRHGLHEFKPAWGGIYNPGHTKPHFIVREADLGERLQQQVEQLEKLPPLAWQGESEDYSSRFLSPARAAAGKLASRRVMPAYAGTVRAGAMAIGGRPGEKSDWRPATPMPFEDHLKASELLQSIDTYGLPVRVTRDVDSVKSDLERWVLLEHRDLAYSRNDLYYGADLPKRHDIAAVLGELIALLRARYNDCTPRRDMLSKLERARARLVGSTGVSP